MKKIIIGVIGLIAVVWLIFFIKDIPKYRFGCFVEGPELKYEHRDADILKLENGNVLILGQNAHSCPTQEACKDNIMPVVEVPSEIYNAKTNKIEELRLPNNIRYQAKGILLKNNRLLLTYAYDPNNNSYPKVKKLVETTKDIKPPYLYDSMAVVNLDTLKVEKVLKRKLDNNILLNSIINEIYINNQDIADLLFANAPSKIFWYERTTLNNNEVIFISDSNKNDNSGDKYTIYKYDNLIKKITSSKLETNLEASIVQKLNTQEVLIIYSNNSFSREHPIKIYNAKTNKIKTIAYMPKSRCDLNGASLNNRYFLIIGGHNCSYPFTRYYKNSLILDLNKNKLYNSAKLPYDVDKPSMVSLNNNNVLILDNKLNAYAKKTLIFKNRK